jgi:hypothetical protein
LIFGCGGNELFAACFAKVKNFALSLLRTGFFLSKKHEPYCHRQIETATTETAGLGSRLNRLWHEIGQTEKRGKLNSK